MDGIQSVQTTVELFDAFTAPMQSIINAANLGANAIAAMQQTAIEGVDPSGIQAMRDYLDQAAASVTDLGQQFSGLQTPINNNTRQQERFNHVIQEGTNIAGGLQNTLTRLAGAYAGISGVKKAFSFIQDSTSFFDTQLNAERQLQGVLANTLDRNYIPEIELETSANITGTVNDLATVQNGVDEVIIPVSAETNALNAAFDTITEKASEIQNRGIYGDEAMIAAAAEFATYFSDTGAIEMMMDSLANYAMGMSGGGALDSTAMVNYATNLGKLMTGAYDAMTKKGFEFNDVQKAIIEGEATREQIIATLGEDYADMSADMQAAATITQIIDEAWAGLYENMSNTPRGKIIQLSNIWGDMKETVGGELYPAVVEFYDVISDNWPTVETIMSVFTDGLILVIDLLSGVVSVAFFVADVFINNWSWIGPIIEGVAAAVIAYNGILLAYKAYTLGAAAAQYVFGGALLQNMHLAGGLALAIGVVVAALGFYTNEVNEAYGLSLSFAGMLGGALMTALAALGNIFIAVAKFGVACWETFQEIGGNIYAFFYNLGIDMAAKLYDLLSMVLSFVDKVCEALNNLPFIEFDYSGITDKANEYAKIAANADNVKIGYDDIGKAWESGWNSIDFIDLNDAFDAGYYLGDEFSKKFGGASSADYSAYNAINEMLANTDAINDSTGSIADSMEITEEDLKYLRDIAEQEAINRFTTAEIHIDAPITNNVSGDTDLDGLIDGLTEALNEAMLVAAEGVHV